MWILYQLALAALFIVAGPFLLLTRGRHYLPTLPGRLGLGYPECEAGSLWLHAVSVGEVGVATILAQALPPDLPLLVTTVTPTGQERALAALGQRATVAYLPFDLGPVVRRFLRHFRPRALVLCEGDLWPLALHAVKNRMLPIVVVNGRVSDRGYKRLRRLGRMRRPLLGPVDAFGVQSPQDAERLLALGVEEHRVTITGNLKFEATAASIRPQLRDQLREIADRRPILVAGSTMDGEEEAVLDAFSALLSRHEALLVLAPRHPERWPEVAALLRNRNIRWIARSALPSSDAKVDAVLLDSLGELAALYSLATTAFIGGTLVPTGGHNPLEAAIWAVPIVVGPSMANFRDIAARFDDADAWKRVADSSGLTATWREWIENPQSAQRVGRRGLELLTLNRGALRRSLNLVSETVHLEAPGEVEGKPLESLP